MKSNYSIEDQAQFLLWGINTGLYNAKDIFLWAESVMDSFESPPPWVVELYTLNPKHEQDYERLFREYVQCSELRPLDYQLQCCVHAYFSRQKTLAEVLTVLFHIIYIDPSCKLTLDQNAQAVGELKDLLVEWDTDLKLDLDLTQRFESVLKKIV